MPNQSLEWQPSGPLGPRGRVAILSPAYGADVPHGSARVVVSVRGAADAGFFLVVHLAGGEPLYFRGIAASAAQDRVYPLHLINVAFGTHHVRVELWAAASGPPRGHGELRVSSAEVMVHCVPPRIERHAPPPRLHAPPPPTVALKPRTPARKLRLGFLGSIARLDGIRSIWIDQLRRMDRSRFDLQYLCLKMHSPRQFKGTIVGSCQQRAE